jgi:hypothetical protein
VGGLSLVLLDPETRRATHFVVHGNGWIGRDVIVPTEWVRQITRDEIFVDVRREQLAQLPEFRDDEKIFEDVLDALWDNTDLPPAELQFVEVRVQDGIVELRGHTLTDEARMTIERITSRVPGVLGVRNRLESFEELTAALHAAQHARSGETARAGRGR